MQPKRRCGELHIIAFCAPYRIARTFKYNNAIHDSATTSVSDKCQCLIHAGNDTNSYKNGLIKPKVSEEEGSDRKVERHTSSTLCLVVLCLLLEILVWAVLNLWLRKRNRYESKRNIVNPLQLTARVHVND